MYARHLVESPARNLHSWKICSRSQNWFLNFSFLQKQKNMRVFMCCVAIRGIAFRKSIVWSNLVIPCYPTSAIIFGELLECLKSITRYFLDSITYPHSIINITLRSIFVSAVFSTQYRILLMFRFKNANRCFGVFVPFDRNVCEYNFTYCDGSLHDYTCANTGNAR